MVSGSRHALAALVLGLSLGGGPAASAARDGYGYTEKDPIKVGGMKADRGPDNERSFLGKLRGPKGEKVRFERRGSCCPFESKNAPMGHGLLDKYEVTYDGQAEPAILYLNMYDFEPARAPEGFRFTWEPSPFGDPAGAGARGEHHVATLRGHNRWVTSLVFLPAGKTLISGSWEHREGAIRHWDLATHEELWNPMGHMAGVLDMSLHPEGIRLATSGIGRHVKVWHLPTAEEVVSFEIGKQASDAIAFDSSGKMVAVATADGPIEFRRAGTGKVEMTLEGHEKGASDLAFSPDGAILASAGRDGLVKLWNLSSEDDAVTIGPFDKGVAAVAWSPDGKFLALACGDGVVRIRKADGSELREIAAHAESCKDVQFHPGGDALASGGGDHLVKLWSVGTGKEIAVLEGHEKTVLVIAFSPDGKLLASAGYDQNIEIWDAAAAIAAGK